MKGQKKIRFEKDVKILNDYNTKKTMKSIRTYITGLALTSSIFLIGCSNESSQNKTPALFNTKAEAEKAAKDFNCSGAHQMGDKWMPCKTHENHQDNQMQSGHGHNH